MPYLNLDPHYFEHPKTRRLVGLLGPMSDILPLRLWAYCAKIHPADGRLKGYSWKEIESVIGWLGAPKKAFSVLQSVGFVFRSSGGFSCVDWKQHQGHLQAFSRRGKAANKARWNMVKKGIPVGVHKSSLRSPPSLPSVPTIPHQPNQLTTAKKADGDLNQETRMPFGEYKGVVIANLDPSYCHWILEDFKGRNTLGKSLADALRARIAEKQEELKPGRTA